MASASKMVTRAPSVLDLSTLQRTLLWAMRAWAAYHDTPQWLQRPLQQVFAEAGLMPAFKPFARFMECWFAGMHRLPDIRCVRCLRMGQDEHAMLQLWLEAGHGATDHIAQVLRRYMQSSAVTLALPAVQALRQVLCGTAAPGMATNHDDDIEWPPACQQHLYHLH